LKPLKLFILIAFFFLGSSAAETTSDIKQPTFYRGIYLNNHTSRTEKKMDSFIQQAKKYNINAFVMDVQKTVGPKRKGRVNKTMAMVPKKILDKVIANQIWPIARVVVFDQGFYKQPSEELVQDRITTALEAAKLGFKEIQFDYIRFADNSGIKVPIEERYSLIEGFLARAGKELAPYQVKIAADVYGRIPLNTSDLIGQRMESLAKVVDIIAPMAYPSHYTWSKNLMANPRHTVFITSKKGKDRVQGQAEIVTWIQGFKLRSGYANMSLPTYIAEQIIATQQAGIRGFLVWNAAQNYNPTWLAIAQLQKK